MTLEEALEWLASDSPAPGAGAAAAWCCAMAAALVEMAAGVALADRDEDPDMERRRARAAELRHDALRLADEDAAAYRTVIDAAPTQRPEALSVAADPPLAIAEAAAETGRLAAASAAEVSGPVVGEARAAVQLAAAATRAAAGLVELNLGAAPQDPRLARARELAREAGRAP
jgi:methenyltetrahydrofolate cyclohydrolase